MPHVDAYALGDRFALQNLKDVAGNEFEKSLNNFTGNEQRMRMAASTIIGRVNDSTPSSDRRLRDVLCSYLLTSMRDNPWLQSLFSMEGSNKVIDDNGDFAEDFSRMVGGYEGLLH